ncbi:MAG: IS3 family transposase [Corynebacterium sp.]|nr:IS3 family transposase [Corynebacterium sp.]
MLILGRSIHYTRLLAVAGLAPSTFHYNLKVLARPDKHAELRKRIIGIYEESRRNYGYRRITAMLRREGRVVNHKLVLKIMREENIQAKGRRRSRYTSYKGAVGRIASNILDRNFKQDAPNQAWVSDVTEFRTCEGKIYLSAILDLYDHMIVGYAIGSSPTVEFTIESLSKALDQYQPEPGIIVHTDQGFQYQNPRWQEALKMAGARQSMSRKGNCYDNAVMENAFGHIKVEMYHGETYETKAKLVNALEDYIQWHNTERIQIGLKGLAPTEYRNQTLAA